MPTELFEAGAPDVVYAIDVSGYVFRAYHAIAPLTSPSGEPTHAIVGTVNMLELLFRERRPQLCAIAMDSGRDTFRKEIFDGYKANRPPAPDDLRSQMKRCQEIVEAFRIPVLRQQGVEADDLIASLVRRATEAGKRVVIVSSDKDLLQLVSDRVVMWDTMKNRVWGPAEAEERFGVRVDQIRDLLALTGDTSDNVPGVPSVGPKTAKDLLVEFGTVDGIYEHLGDIKKRKLAQTLHENEAGARLSLTLVTLKSDCAVDIAALGVGARDLVRLRRIYGELGFTRQLAAIADAPSLDASPRGPVSAPVTKELRSAIIATAGDLRAVLERAQATERIAIELAMSSDSAMTSDLVGLAIAAEAGFAHYVPIAHRYVGAPKQLSLDDVTGALAPILGAGNVRVAGHDLKTTAVCLTRLGVSIATPAFDSMLASYLLDPAERHDLPRVAGAVLDVKLAELASLTTKGRGRDIGLDETTVEEAMAVAAPRAEALLRLEDAMLPTIVDAGMGELWSSIELPLAALLAEMERTGVLVDTKRLQIIGEAMRRDLERLEREAHDAAGKEWNVSSPRQLETILFDELGLSPQKRTKTARSTDAATLEALADEHALPKIVLEHRQIAKLLGTYVDALPLLVNPKTGRIHGRWDQAVAATGRLSSSDPNLQNIPIRTERGRAIREAFVAPKGYVLVSADYSQIELRVLAHLSKDPVLIDSFRKGQDVHLRTAMEIFEVDEKSVTREHRSRAKAVNFGVIYGQGDSGLAKSLGISRGDAARFIATYFQRYAGVREFMDRTLERARAGETVTTLFGRRRAITGIRSANRAERFAAERIAMNTPIQGTAADLLKKAMLALREPVAPGARMILTVHDELVFEVPEEHAKDAMPRIRSAMENVQPLDVPLVVDVGVGETWGQAHG